MRTYRDYLIESFREELGDYIEKIAKQQSGNKFFQEQAEECAFDYDDHLYRLNENGEMVQLSLEETERIKKKYKREEIENQIPYEAIKSKIKPFEILQVFFPHTDEEDTYSIRPALALPSKKNGSEYSFMLITKGAKTDPIYRRFEVSLKDWKEEGLTVPSFVRTNLMFSYDNIIFIKNYRHYGYISDSDITEIRKMFRTLIKKTFYDPVAFMYWLIRNKVTDTTKPMDKIKCQSIGDIMKSKTANHVDIALVVNQMCTPLSDINERKTYCVSWYVNQNKTLRYLFTLIKCEGKIYAFDYDQDKCVGSFKSFSDSWQSSAYFFCNNLKNHHPDEDVRNLPDEKQVITPLSDLDVEDAYTFDTQEEWMNAILPKQRIYEWVQYNHTQTLLNEEGYVASSEFIMLDTKIPVDISCFTRERCKDAELWVKRTGFPLIIPSQSWDAIRDAYQAYRMKTYTKRLYLDEVSLHIFGKTIPQIYKIMYNRFMNDGKVSENDTIAMLHEDSDLIEYNGVNKVIAFLLNESLKPQGPMNEYKIKHILKECKVYNEFDPNLPFYNVDLAPYEIAENIGVFSDSVLEGQNFDYEKWLTVYSEAYFGLDNQPYLDMDLDRLHLSQRLSLLKESPIKKESLLRIGINPQVETNYAQRYEAIKECLTRDYKITTINLEPFISLNKSTESINENMDQFSESKPVFIVFKRTLDSITNTIISKATNSYWAHAAFSFDYTLKECYTFDFHHHGFTKESIYSYPKGTIIKVMCCFIPRISYERIKQEIEHFKSIKSKTSYSLSNLIACLRRKANENTTSMVCSNFVDYLLKIGDVSPSKLSWSIITPGRLSRSIARSRKKKFYQVFKGDIAQYNANNVLLYLSKCSIDQVLESTSPIDQEISRLYKQLVEPYLNLVPIEE